MATVPLNATGHGGKKATARTLTVCNDLTDDREEMVVKALSWALRELCRQDCAAVERFLNRHDDRLAARVIREVNNKLKTGLKNPVKLK